MNTIKQKLVDKSLNIQIILLTIIPIFYILLVYSVAGLSEISIQQYLENNLSETLRLLSISCYLISAAIISKYKKQPNQKYLLLSYLIIFVSNIVNFNIIIIGFMGVYTKNFINLKEMKSYFNKLDNENGRIIMIISIIILFISMLITFTRFSIS